MGMRITDEDEKRLKFYYIENANPNTCGVSIKYITDSRNFPFAFIANYKITKVRAFEFARIIGASIGAVQGWVRKGLIRSERIGRNRWLDIDSAYEFVKNDGRITMAQEELFVERLVFIYALINEEMQEDLERSLVSYLNVI